VGATPFEEQVEASTNKIHSRVQDLEQLSSNLSTATDRQITRDIAVRADLAHCKLKGILGPRESRHFGYESAWPPR